VRGLVVREQATRKGLLSIDWPGRLELVPGTEGRPQILLDGAHNPDGARALASFLRSHFPDRRKILVFGVMKDKDFRGMLAELLPVVQQVILTRPKIVRAAVPAEIAVHAPGAIIAGSVRDALSQASRAAGSMDLVVVAGSFYTVGEVKELLDEPH
jgi:dihydrofolate synthase/folylpolyglutamate synthase